MTVRRFWQVNVKAAALWYEHDGDLLAATVSYYALFAITPLLLLSISLMSVLYGSEFVNATFLQWGSILGSDLLSLLSHAVENLALLSGKFSVPVVGIVFFSGMTILMLNTFTTGIHQLWGIPHQGFRGWIKKCLFSVLFVGVLEIYLLLLVGVHWLVDFLNFSLSGFLVHSVHFGVSLILTTFLFSLMYHFLPWQHPPMEARLGGAFIASLLFTVGKFVVAYYVSKTPVPELFGAAGVLIVLLIWVYVSAAILYYGAALAYMLSDGHLLKRSI